MSYPDFCRWLATPWGDDEFADRHWMSQSRLFDSLPERGLDFLGKYENLNDDWAELLKNVGDSARGPAESQRQRGEAKGYGTLA